MVKFQLVLDDEFVGRVRGMGGMGGNGVSTLDLEHLWDLVRGQLPVEPFRVGDELELVSEGSPTEGTVRRTVRRVYLGPDPVGDVRFVRVLDDGSFREGCLPSDCVRRVDT